MSQHVTISPSEAADRLAIRELVEAYAHCADRRDAKGQMALFTADTYFVVYMNAKDPKPSQELHSREALAPVFAELNQVRGHHALCRTEHNLHSDGRPRHGRSLLPCASRHGRRGKAAPDARLAPLPRHVREDGRCLAVCRAPALRRLDGGARTVMKVPTAGQKRLVIVGATGMVGGYALRYALEHPAVGRATAIGRRKLGISHPKLTEVLHRDFADCSALAETLSGQDAAVFCLGTYTGAVSDAELRKITVDYTIEFARVLRGSSPDAAFSFLSGNGADPTGRSRMAFARYKGEAEKALLAAGFPRVYLFRPAYIYPVEPRKEPNFSYRLLRGDLPRVSGAVPQPGDSGRRLGPRHGGCRRQRNRGSAEARFSRTVTSEPWSSRFNLYGGDSARDRGFEQQARALSAI